MDFSKSWSSLCFILKHCLIILLFLLATGEVSSQSVNTSYGECLTAEGDSLVEEFEYQRAIETYEAARNALKAEEKFEAYCSVLNKINWLKNNIGEDDGDLITFAYEEAGKLLPNTHPEYAKACITVAVLDMFIGTEATIQHASQMMKIAKETASKTKDLQLNLHYYLFQLDALNQKGRYLEALDVVNKMDDLIRTESASYLIKSKFFRKKAAIASNLQSASLIKEAVIQEETLLSQKNGKNVTVSDTFGLLTVYYSLEFYANITGNTKEAISYSNKIIEIESNCSVMPDWAPANSLLHRSTWKTNLYGPTREAEADILKAISLLKGSKRRNNLSLLSYSYTLLSQLYQKRSNFIEAERSLDLARQIAKSNQLSMIHVNTTSSRLFLRKGEFNKALSTSLRTIKQTPYSILVGFKGEEYGIVARSYASLGNLDSALFYCQQSICYFSDGFSDSSIFCNPSEYHHENESDLSRMILLKADYLRKKSDSDRSLLHLTNETYSLGAKILDQSRSRIGSENDKSELAEKGAKFYDGIVTTSIDLWEATGDTSYLLKAFVNSEKSNGLILWEAQWESRIKQLVVIPDSMLQKSIEIERTLTKLQNQILLERKKGDDSDSLLIEYFRNELFETKRIKKVFEDTLKIRFPEYLAVRDRKLAVSTSTVMDSVLNKGELMLEFFLTEKELFTFALTKSGIKVYRKPIPKDLDQRIELLHRSISDFNYVHDSVLANFTSFTENASYLYNLLLKDVLGDHPDTKSLLTIPDGKLGGIPFEVLLQDLPQTSQVDFTILPYLIKDYKIRYGHSAALLYEQKHRTSQPSIAGCLAMAPSFEISKSAMEGNLRTLRSAPSTLPGAQREVQLLAESGIPGEFLFGENATEKKFKELSPQYSILHLALHGQADELEPLSSNLKFSESLADTAEDNTLYAIELNSIPLHADLAVLSACNSGSGKLSAGEGVLSLARSFLAAGARAVVSTLWSVEDMSSEKLMGNFYAHLSEGESSATALHKAKLELLEHSDSRTAHPIYWAGYIAQGDVVPTATQSTDGGWTWWVLGLIALFLIAVAGGLKGMRVG